MRPHFFWSGLHPVEPALNLFAHHAIAVTVTKGLNQMALAYLFFGIGAACFSAGIALIRSEKGITIKKRAQ